MYCVCFTEKTVVHGPTEHLLDTKPVVLFVISPNHGHAQYMWERLSSGVWVELYVSKWICLVYIYTPGTYHCTVDKVVVDFSVKAAAGQSVLETSEGTYL